MRSKRWLSIAALNVGLALCGFEAAFADLVDDLPPKKPVETPADQGKPAGPQSPTRPPSPAPAAPQQGKEPTPPGKPEEVRKAASPQKPAKGKKSRFTDFDTSLPIEYASLGLHGNRMKGFFELLKDVRVKQGDLELFSDAAKVILDQMNEEIAQVIADGNVRVNKIDPDTGKLMQATAEQAVYYRLENKIEFKGKAKVTRGTEVLEGESITYNLLTGDFEIERPKGLLSDELNRK